MLWSINYNLPKLTTMTLPAHIIIGFFLISVQLMTADGSHVQGQATNPEEKPTKHTPKDTRDSIVTIFRIIVIILEIIGIIILMYFVIRARIALTRPKLSETEEVQMLQGFEKRHINPDVKWDGVR